LFKHTGDGVCAAFASPKSAVDAAVAAQRALELPVRMGLATGEAERDRLLRLIIDGLRPANATL
jgi:class 3 adenylate cyclase